MSSLGRAVSGAAGRLRSRSRKPGEEYVLCPTDGFWFRPPYTEGKCPLCGELASGGAPPLPLLIRADRFGIGMATFVLGSLAMSILVLLAYFKT